MSSTNIRDILTSFSPSLDFFAISSGDGRIKIWDTLKGQLQTEFADITANNALEMQNNERGHLSLDYKCMKWVQLETKKFASSLLVLGTGNGDVLALDVALGQLKWKVSDCHPGGVTAVSYSGRYSCIYTAGVDGMVCQIDSLAGKILGKFKASTKAISALSISPDGKLLATASAQLKIFNCKNKKKIQKISGHPVTVRCMSFSEDGSYILSSAVGEKSIVIWKKIEGGKNQSASCILSMEHPAILLDTKCSDSEGIYVLAISEMGICYFWYARNTEELQVSKPTKISLSVDTSLPRHNKNLTIFAAKVHHIISVSSMKTLIAYGSLVKPSFQKLTMEYGKHINLNVSQDGVLLPVGQSNISLKSHTTQIKVTALDRANAEDAILPLPKLYVQEKKRKHGMEPMVSDTKNVAEPATMWHARAEVQAQKREKECLTLIEDRLKSAGILDTKDNDIPDSSIDATIDIGAHLSIDVNMPTKKIRSKILSVSPRDAYKLLENCFSTWRARSAASKHVLPWIYHILVIHGQFIISQESAKQLLEGLHKMTKLRCASLQPLLNLLGSLQLIMAQIDKANSGRTMVQDSPADSNSERSDDEEDEEIDELVYREEDNTSQSGSDDDNEMR